MHTFKFWSNTNFFSIFFRPFGSVFLDYIIWPHCSKSKNIYWYHCHIFQYIVKYRTGNAKITAYFLILNFGRLFYSIFPYFATSQAFKGFLNFWLCTSSLWFLTSEIAIIWSRDRSTEQIKGYPIMITGWCHAVI